MLHLPLPCGRGTCWSPVSLAGSYPVHGACRLLRLAVFRHSQAREFPPGVFLAWSHLPPPPTPPPLPPSFFFFFFFNLFFLNPNTHNLVYRPSQFQAQSSAALSTSSGRAAVPTARLQDSRHSREDETLSPRTLPRQPLPPALAPAHPPSVSEIPPVGGTRSSCLSVTNVLVTLQ